MCNVEDLLKNLHLRQTDGSWLKGLEANVYIWSKTSYGWFFKLLMIWPIRPIAQAAYRHWAKQRFDNRFGCKSCDHT